MLDTWTANKTLFHHKDKPEKRGSYFNKVPLFLNLSHMNPFGENTHSEMIVLPGGAIAFVDGIPDKCEHDWNGDVVLQSASGKIIYWHTYRQWASLCTDARRRLVYDHHTQIDDPIIMETGSCKKCKKIFHPPLF